MKEKTKTNAERFVDAYNLIDHTLRSRHNIRRSLSFSDMVRKTVVVDYIVRKYEDDLVDYGRLRNAIIHQNNDKKIIAEPHIDVVEDFERIAKLISAPPKVLDTVCNKEVLIVEYNTPLLMVIKLIASSKYSNIPIYKKNGLIGVANGQKIINYIGQTVFENESMDKFLAEKTVEDYAKFSKNEVHYYEVVDKDITVEKALNMFYQNRKLLIIIITEHGVLEEMPIGIVTPTDIMDLNKVIE